MNRNSGKVPGVAGGSAVKGAVTEQQTAASSASQQWRISDVTGINAVTLTSRKSDQVLDVKANSTADGASVIQYPAHGSANQQWRLEKAPEATTSSDTYT